MERAAVRLIGIARRGASNLVTMLAGRLATQVVLVASAVVIPKVLGAETYGQYAAVMAILAMVQTISTFGLPMVEVRELPPLLRSQEAERGSILGSTIWVTRLVLSILSGTVAYFWLGGLPDLAASSMVLPLAIFAIFRGAFEATRSQLLPLGRVDAYVVLDVLRAVLVLVVVVVAYWLAGIEGVFWWLAVVFLVLVVLAEPLLRRSLPLHLSNVRWRSLQPHFGYSLAAFIGELSVISQVQFAILVVAIRTGHTDAGIIALTLQLHAFFQALYLTGRSSLMPILAELEAGRDLPRLRLWGSLMMRYGAAIASVGCVAWALLGGHVLAWLLPPEFAPVHRMGTVIILGVAFYCCAIACEGLLYIRGRARLASGSSLIYTATTIAGVLLVLNQQPGLSLWIAGVYAMTAAAFFATTYLLLGWFGGLRLPLRRTALLLLPAVFALPANEWQGAVAVKLVLLIGFATVFVLGARALRLLPADESRDVWRAIVSRSRSNEVA